MRCRPVSGTSLRRHGLEDREPATLAEMGRELGLMRERVRQPQREAEDSISRSLVRGQIRSVSGTDGAVVYQQRARSPLASRQRTSSSWFRSSMEPVPEVEP